jgi:hypothetical protein
MHFFQCFFRGLNPTVQYEYICTTLEMLALTLEFYSTFLVSVGVTFILLIILWFKEGREGVGGH